MGTFKSANAFVQIGATRDGLDPYLDCAADRGMLTVLVETPAYLHHRRVLFRRSFDVELGMSEPQDAAAVAAALATADVAPTLVLAGFERYVSSAFSVAEKFGAFPHQGGSQPFVPMDKWGQRKAVALAAPDIAQPWFMNFPAGASIEGRLTRCNFPCVVKPADGGGGLGVFLADGPVQMECALSRLQTMQNYGGGSFSGLLVEEFLDGPESSLQGIVYEGQVVVLTACDKVIAHEEVPGCPDLMGFREVGHVAVQGARSAPDSRRLTEAVVAATGYQQGPFHIDIIRCPKGPVFVEIGFRLSGGGLVDLVQRVTGERWADLAFRAYLGEASPGLWREAADRVVGQVEAVDEDEIANGEALQARGAGVEVFRYPTVAPSVDVAAHEQTLLASDLLRHSGGVGRIVATGDDAEEVRRRLEGCIGGRLREENSRCHGRFSTSGDRTPGDR